MPSGNIAEANSALPLEASRIPFQRPHWGSGGRFSGHGWPGSHARRGAITVSWVVGYYIALEHMGSLQSKKTEQIAESEAAKPLT